MAKMKKYRNPYMFSEDPNHMGLGDYLHPLGDERGNLLCRDTGIPQAVISNIQDGYPIASIHATKIAEWLSKQYQRQIKIDDIANLQVINPGRKLPAPPAAE